MHATAIAAQSSERHREDPIRQKHGRPSHLLLVNKGDNSPTAPGHGAPYNDWTTELLGTCRNVQGMNAVKSRSAFKCLDYHVQRPRVWVDHRSPLNTHLGKTGSLSAAQIGNRYSRNIGGGIREADAPQGSRVAALIAVGVEGVKGVVHRPYIDDVVDPEPWNGDVGHDERLPHDKAINWIRKEFSKLRGVHVAGIEQSLIGIRTCARCVVVEGHDICLRLGR